MSPQICPTGDQAALVDITSSVFYQGLCTIRHNIDSLLSLPANDANPAGFTAGDSAARYALRDENASRRDLPLPTDRVGQSSVPA
jgi:hypothetical protein